jgi:hypothetical protein
MVRACDLVDRPYTNLLLILMNKMKMPDAPKLNVNFSPLCGLSVRGVADRINQIKSL